MSKQYEQTDSNLIESISQQLNLYDNLFPQVENGELKVLFALTRIYLARCDNPKLKQEQIMIDPSLTKRLALTYFDPFTAPATRNIRDALISRLTSIRKYRITKPEVVRRTLITCLAPEGRRIRTKQKLYLDTFMKNPGSSYTEIAKQLGFSPQAVSHASNSLQKSSLLRFYGYINYPMFKLRHFIVFFNILEEYRGKDEYLRRLLFDNLPFALNLNSDVYEGSSWASFVIPNHSKELNEFKESLNELKGEVFRDINLVELKSFSTGSNLEFFDGRSWFFDPQLWAYGFFEFIRENKEISRKAAEFHYSAEPLVFDRKDFLIAAICATDPLISHSEIKKRLTQFGYGISRPTVTRKINRLMSAENQSLNGGGEKQPAIYPYMTYWGLGLDNLNAYLIECDEEQVEELRYAVGYLPYYFLYRTDRGVLLFIKSAASEAAKINYMIKGINEITVVASSNRFENIGGRSLIHLYEKWNDSRQQWTRLDGELNFLRRYESLP
ncbi:MAG: winged helix-turn-helix domain-containing protein [Candidatus Atabeyarchaeum deiterrae]